MRLDLKDVHWTSGSVLSISYTSGMKNTLYYTIIDWWWGQHIICCPNPQSFIALLYLHWLRIKYSIKTIHKQTDHDQTGLNLDKLIWDELALVWINSYTITPVQVIQDANNKSTQFGTKWFQTKWIQNESTCLWRQKRHSGPTLIFICPRSNIDLICPLLRTLTIGII